MESFRILACIAFLAVCAYAEDKAAPVEQYAPGAPNLAADPTMATNMMMAPKPEEGLARQKKQALYPYAYSAYPYYAGSYGAAYGYPYAYSGAYAYGAYDDGKYYPGKYERPYQYRSYPGYYNSPYYYYY